MLILKKKQQTITRMQSVYINELKLVGGRAFKVI